uniref:DNA polymerase n=1 Tax=Meloidogyne hapla TaxID=6305 RepID=A0A1I8B2I3_MELHA
MADSLENDVSEDSPKGSRRLRRSTASVTNSRQNTLERLKQARMTGKVFRARVDDLIQDVYVEVDDEEYQAKKQFYREFVEDDVGASYYDEDSDDDEEHEKQIKKKKEGKKAKSGTIKHHFQSIANNKKPSDEKNIRVEDDDILNECLADIIGTSNLSTENTTSVFEDPFLNNSTLRKPQQSLQQSSQKESDVQSINPFKASTLPPKSTQKSSLSSRKSVTKEDLHSDIQKTFKTLGINKFKIKPEFVTKRFISPDASVPKECETVEVWANCDFGRIPTNLSGDCFSHVMNTTTTALERLLIEREIYGPCWLEIRNAEIVDSHVSHCQHEYSLNMDQMDYISMSSASSTPIPPPSITLVALNILTALNPETKDIQIVMISLIHHSCNLEMSTNFEPKSLITKRFCVVSKFNKGLTLPFDLEDQLKRNGIATMVRRVGDELSLLNIFLSKIAEIDPDLILAHDLNAQLTLIQTRMEKYKLRKWDRLGRLKRSVQIQKIGRSKFAQWELTAGRLCLDTKIAASELIHCRSYEMEDLVETLLKMNRQNLSTEQISEPFLITNPKIKLIDLIKWNWNENLYTLKLVEHLNSIPLFVQITQIVGGVLSRTLMGGRAERNEYLLLHACHRNNCVPPDKYNAQKSVKATTLKKQSKKLSSKNGENNQEVNDGDIEEIVIDAEPNVQEEVQAQEETEMSASKQEGKINKNNKKTQYTGGLVLEPKIGLYETFIVLLDFNSLYPSIIQEFNICFTTIDQAFDDLAEMDLPNAPGSSRPDGILKNEIRKLVNRRKEVKKLMSKEKHDSEKYQQYNIRQIGLKLTANSMYGCLGFQQSRFFAKTLAAMITSKGRELLLHTRTLVENENFSVIYGDTDSLMVNTNTTNFQEAKQIGQKLKQVVNKNYSLLELDIDGIYKRLLLLKKKKYAALSVDLNDENSTTAELKGLDIVRRDWSELAKDIGLEIVNLILSSIDRNTLIERITSVLALRREDLEEGRFPLEKFEILKQLTRDPIDYKDIKSQPHAVIARRLNESKKFRLRQGDIVKYIICTTRFTDKNYYLAQQIHPIVMRLCEPIIEMDAYKIAEILGLDPSGYRKRVFEFDNGDKDNAFGINKDEKIDLSVVFAPFLSK